MNAKLKFWIKFKVFLHNTHTILILLSNVNKPSFTLNWLGFVIFNYFYSLSIYIPQSFYHSWLS